MKRIIRASAVDWISYISDVVQYWYNCINHKRINREIVAGLVVAGGHTDLAVGVGPLIQATSNNRFSEGYSSIIVFTDSCSVTTVAVTTVVDLSRQSRKEGIIWCVVIS